MAFSVLNVGQSAGQRVGHHPEKVSHDPPSLATPCGTAFDGSGAGFTASVPLSHSLGVGHMGHSSESTPESGTLRGTASGTHEPDPFLARHHVLVYLDSVGDVWLASDEEAIEALQAEGIPVLLERDARWVLQAEDHEARLARLRAVLGKRHPLTQAVLDIFAGSRVNSVTIVMP